ncbi:MAG TPA: hypothetical protein PLF51_17925, partial [Candidatus Hydrogenedentes bacterium]|nr:hypothetical protein [Candidatus Hydrogenedentota bacterium]
MNQSRPAAVCFRALRRSLFVLCACLGLLSAAAFAADPNPPTIHSERGAWPIRRQWTLAETRHFAQWIQHIYKAK